METLEGLHELIKNRLIEKKGNIRLNENSDIIAYGKVLGLNENQLLFRVIEIEETIDWTELERKISQENEIKSEKSTSNYTSPPSTSDIIYCSNCNAVNGKGIANFCKDCGTKLNQVQSMKVEKEQTYQPETSYIQQDNYSAPAPEIIKKSKLPIILGIIGGLIVILALVYYFWGKDYLRDKNAPRLYSFASSLALRSSPAAGGNFNLIGNIPYGSEILVYETGTEWIKCKVDGKEGYASPKYMLNKLDFHELNAILADEDTRTAVKLTRYKKALLSYFRSHDIIGKMDEHIQNELYGAVSTKQVWQLFAKAAPSISNTVYFSTVSNQNSKYKDFACIIKNINTGERKIIMFSFDALENPKFEGEAPAPNDGDISSIEYYYDEYSQNTTLTPIFTTPW
jgi:hypothetical protein